MDLVRISGGGGVELAMRVAGRADAPPILLLHGWSQHSLCWQKQMAGPLVERFRLAALDLRGHGASGKPADLASYADGTLWAEDIGAAVAYLGRPVVVGWSMGGWVLQDYLRHRGDAAVAGLVFVASGCRVGEAALPVPGPTPAARRRIDGLMRGMCARDQARQLEAGIGFAKAMTLATLSKRDLAAIVGWQMLCPPEARIGCGRRSEDWRAVLARVRVPSLAVHGAADRVCAEPAVEELCAALPSAKALSFAASGHMPFWEEAERFDTELASFAAAALGLSEAAA